MQTTAPYLGPGFAGRVAGIACIAENPMTEAAELRAMSGDIESFLNGLPLPGSGTEAFVQPSAADEAIWRQAIDALLLRQ